MSGKISKLWLVGTIILLIIIIVGVGIIRVRYPRSQPIQVSEPTPQNIEGEVYVGGAVNNPGIYPLFSGDTIASLIQAAGGKTRDFSPISVKLYITDNLNSDSQKIDINRAEAWLLSALPGIGEIKAAAIIDYRKTNGNFKNTYELTRVEGISETSYEKIKGIVTVEE